MAWLNPSAPDPLDVNWQSKHGVWALAAGGIGGTGFGDSKMKWSWIPEVENDFIFAIIGEEFGLVGAIVVIGLFITLGFVLIKITLKTRGVYERYILVGIMGWIVLQAMVNIAVVLNFLPVLGVPLPLISSGGSSLLSTLAAIGVVLGIERRNSVAPIARVNRVSRR
jgi:cell division protein FtsW (lipid II flippase)